MMLRKLKSNENNVTRIQQELRQGAPGGNIPIVNDRIYDLVAECLIRLRALQDYGLDHDVEMVKGKDSHGDWCMFYRILAP